MCSPSSRTTRPLGVVRNLVPLFSLATALLFSPTTTATADTVEQLYGANLRMRRQSLVALNTWSAAHIAWGAYEWTTGSEVERARGQATVAWNTVNLAINTIGLLRHDFETIPPIGEAIENSRTFDTFTALSVGLGVSYLAQGAWVWERGVRLEDERLEGYGQAIVIGGAALLIWDGVRYLLNRGTTSGLIGRLEAD